MAHTLNLKLNPKTLVGAQLALKWHPDKNTDNMEEATERSFVMCVCVYIYTTELPFRVSYICTKTPTTWRRRLNGL